MRISFDNALGDHAAALGLRAKRTELLASNLANNDTPGYRARDINFAAAFTQAAETSLRLSTAHPGHLQLNGSEMPDPLIQYRQPLQPSVDGNTVDGDQELAMFAQNRVAFEASFSFLNSRFKSLVGALRGE